MGLKMADLLGAVYDTFIENPIESFFDKFKEKLLTGAPYLFASGFILVGVLVIFRRVGR